MDSYTSEWNKETVMANATRLLHITQELAVDAVPKYTKKQYARLGFGSSSLMALEEADELALVQEAYNIAWTLLNLTLEYTPIARTDLKLHTHHGALGNFIGTLAHEGTVMTGDDQGVYTCSNSGYMVARWSKPRTARMSEYPNFTEAYTGRVLTGTRTSTIQTGWPTDLNTLTDIERMSLEEPTSFLLGVGSWWLTWYPKQQYMMIHQSDYSTTSCIHPSEVTWSYRIAPSSYKQFVFHNEIWEIPASQSYTVDFKRHFPYSRHQTDYSYEVLNAVKGFDWVEVQGSLPVYKCPPMLVKYFNDSFKGVRFEGDSSLERYNNYTEILESIEDPRDVGGYVIWETVVKLDKVHYLQAEFFTVPMSEVFPIRGDTFCSREYKVGQPRAHASGGEVAIASNAPLWIYYSHDAPEITVPTPRPQPKRYYGTILYRLKWNTEIARNAAGLAMYPKIRHYMADNEGYFDDKSVFETQYINMLGVRYTPEGEAYAICIAESWNVRAWTEWDNSDVLQKIPYPPETRVLKAEVTGVDWKPLQKFLKFRLIEPLPEFTAPTFRFASYHFSVQLAQRYDTTKSSWTSGKVEFWLKFIWPNEKTEPTTRPRFWVYSQESEQYQYILNTPTGNSGFYKPPLPADTHTLPKVMEYF